MIKVCKSNKHYDEITKALKANDMEYEHKKCLDKCGMCQEGPFVKRHGEFIAADNVEKLIKKLKKE